jgi:hypothetical protein
MTELAGGPVFAKSVDIEAFPKLQFRESSFICGWYSIPNSNIPNRKTPFRTPAVGIPRVRGAWRPTKKASPKAASKKATAI